MTKGGGEEAIRKDEVERDIFSASDDYPNWVNRETRHKSVDKTLSEKRRESKIEHRRSSVEERALNNRQKHSKKMISNERRKSLEHTIKDPRKERNLDNVQTKYIENSNVKDLYEVEGTPNQELQRESLYTTSKKETVQTQYKWTKKQENDKNAIKNVNYTSDEQIEKDPYCELELSTKNDKDEFEILMTK